MYLDSRSRLKRYARSSAVSPTTLALPAAHCQRAHFPPATCWQKPALEPMDGVRTADERRRAALVWTRSALARRAAGYVPECRLGAGAQGSLAADFGSVRWTGAGSSVCLAYASRSDLSR